MSEQNSVIIIGAGISGLIAARELEQAGLKPLLLEAGDRSGGRIKTDEVQGCLLDHGFQVLLTAYREARHYLDFADLNLQTFDPGAYIYDRQELMRIGDPLRDPGNFPTMLFSQVGNIKDKWLIWQLTRKLKATPVEELFTPDQPSTLVFLRNYGFSERIIRRFFRPFFGGIFLENELRTPAGMFRFVFKMFSEGEAALPENGIEAIPRQLFTQLRQTQTRFNCRVQQVAGQELILEDGERLPFEHLLIATDPHPILPNLAGQQQEYQSTCNLYYLTNKSPLDHPLIALVADEDRLINNWCVPSDLVPAYAPEGRSLLSVTLKEIPENLTEEELTQKVAAELRHMTGLSNWPLEFIARYDIPQALPALDLPTYDQQATQHRLTERIFLAGDYLLNASLDAAMRSGRNAALALLESADLPSKS